MPTAAALLRQAEKRDRSYQQYQEDSAQLGRMILAAIDEQGWTQQRVAAALGLTKGRVNEIVKKAREKARS